MWWGWLPQTVQVDHSWRNASANDNGHAVPPAVEHGQHMIIYLVERITHIDKLCFYYCYDIFVHLMYWKFHEKYHWKKYLSENECQWILSLYVVVFHLELLLYIDERQIFPGTMGNRFFPVINLTKLKKLKYVSFIQYSVIWIFKNCFTDLVIISIEMLKRFKKTL